MTSSDGPYPILPPLRDTSLSLLLSDTEPFLSQGRLATGSEVSADGSMDVDAEPVILFYKGQCFEMP